MPGVTLALDFPNRGAQTLALFEQLDTIIDRAGGRLYPAKDARMSAAFFQNSYPGLDDFEPFHPDRMASRILGMGDILSLVEDARRGVDEEKAKEFAQKLKSGKGFDLNDFKEQIGQMRKMGGMSAFMDKLPAQFAQAAGQLQAAGLAVEVQPLGRLDRERLANDACRGDDDVGRGAVVFGGGLDRRRSRGRDRNLRRGRQGRERGSKRCKADRGFH